jgi:hypothetical protein
MIKQTCLVQPKSGLETQFRPQQVGAAASKLLSASLRIILIALFLAGISALSDAQAAGPKQARSSQESKKIGNQSPKLQDFKSKRLSYPEQIEEEHLQPLLDEGVLERQITELLVPLSVGASKLELANWRPLSFHLVMRYETPSERQGFADWHFPPGAAHPDSQPEKLPEEYSIYQEKLAAALNDIAASGNITLTPDAARADVLIHINMAERSQTSSGFNYEDMPLYGARHPDVAQGTDSGTVNNELKTVELLFPFAIARVAIKAGPTLLGGEIWIEYPKRSYWQSRLAQVILDDPGVGMALGFGQTRDSVVSRFRRPHKMVLESLRDAFSSVRARPPTRGSRPGETLLSIASAALQPREGLLGQSIPIDGAIQCGALDHATNLAHRLQRLVAIWSTGARLGGYVVSAQADYTAEFRQDTSRFMADVSLGTYQQTFDHLLDDALADLLSRQMKTIRSEKSDGTWSLQSPERHSKDFLQATLSDIAEVNKMMAKQLAWSGSCLSRGALDFPLTDLVKLTPPNIKLENPQ